MNGTSLTAPNVSATVTVHARMIVTSAQTVLSILLGTRVTAATPGTTVTQTMEEIAQLVCAMSMQTTAVTTVTVTAEFEE